MLTRSHRLLLLGLIAILALVGAGCGGGDEGGGGGDPEARGLLERAFAKQIDSGDVAIDVKADLKGSASLNGAFSVSVSGPFQSRGKTELPLLDWDIAVQGQGQSLEGALVLAQDNAFVEFQGQSYELGTEIYQQFAQSYGQQQEASGAQSLDDLGVDPASWLEEPTVEDGEEIGGDATQLVAGSVDVGKLVRDFSELVQNPAVQSQLESQGQEVPEEPTEEEIQQVEDAIEDVTFESNVDNDDNLRRLLLDIAFQAPEGEDTSELESGTVSIETTLESIGGEADIQEPTNAAPISELLQRFGLGGTPALP
jgi:hypothetical protein